MILFGLCPKSGISILCVWRRREIERAGEKVINIKEFDMINSIKIKGIMAIHL